MTQFGGKNTKKSSSSDSKRHFTVVMGGKEHGLYVSSTPSSAAKKAVTKLCSANKSKKVQFEIREITQGSKKKTYGPYTGHIEKIKEPIKLKGRVIRYKPVAKLSGKSSLKKGRIMKGGDGEEIVSIYFDLGPENSENLFNKNIEELIKLNESNIFKVNIRGGNVLKQRITVCFKNRDYRKSMAEENFGEELNKLKKVLRNMKTFASMYVENFSLEFCEHKLQPNPIDYSLNKNNRSMDNNSITRYNDFLTKLKKEIES
jgi:hypothetical protein